MEVTVDIIGEQTCNSRAVYNGAVTKNMLCAGHLSGGKDSCQVSSPCQTDVYTMSAWLSLKSAWCEERTLFLRGTAVDRWCVRMETVGSWWASPAGVRAAVKETSLVFTPKSGVSCPGSTATCRWDEVKERVRLWMNVSYVCHHLNSFCASCRERGPDVSPPPPRWWSALPASPSENLHYEVFSERWRGLQLYYSNWQGNTAHRETDGWMVACRLWKWQSVNMQSMNRGALSQCSASWTFIFCPMAVRWPIRAWSTRFWFDPPVSWPIYSIWWHFNEAIRMAGPSLMCSVPMKHSPHYCGLQSENHTL